MTTELRLPTDEATIRSLHAGDAVSISGRMVTGRDAAHAYLLAEDRPELRELLEGSFIYHCGPVVRRLVLSRKTSNPHDYRRPDHDTGENSGLGDSWEFVSAGPTTSIREEPYQADVIARYGLRGVIGKGGMGAKTLAACGEHGAVYLHAIGGAGAAIASAVQRVVEVRMLEEFGVPEAFWVIDVKDFPAIVTMDAHGRSLHEEVEARSRVAYDALL